MFTNLFAVASIATCNHKQAVSWRNRNGVDWSVAGVIMHRGLGEDFQPLIYEFNKDTLYSMDFYSRMMEESASTNRLSAGLLC
jgi:hypothetical protein